MKKNLKAALAWAKRGILRAPFVAFAGFQIPGSTSLQCGSIMSIITNFMYWALVLLGVFAVIGFVIAGIMYLISAGNETMQEKAKKAMIYAIVGVIVGLVGAVVMTAVQGWFGGTNNTF